MKQMQVDESLVVHLNYEAADLPAPVREFRPLLYQEGNSFCCVLGPNPQIGVFGCGETKEEAIKDWVADFKRRTTTPQLRQRDNEVTRYIMDALSTSNRPIS